MTSGYFESKDKRPGVDDEALDAHEVPEELEDGGATGPLGEYFRSLTREAHRCYAVAKQARARGVDPEDEPEIPFAEDLASRVEALVGPEGVAARIRELADEVDREELALTVSKEVAAGRFAEYDTDEAALDAAIRAGLAILTEGILVAPLEGVADVEVRVNDDGSRYADVYFAGPIRAAGGTGQALSVLIADVVRRELGLGAYEATRGEVERFKEEIPAYKKAANLQYTPSADEIELIVQNLPVGVNGEGTESEEVSGQRDLPRVDTNQLRGGACLVLAEGMTLKAPKLKKHVEALGLEGWGFLDAYIKLTKDEDEADEGDEDEGTTIGKDTTFIQELTAGRPVVSHPMAEGGFRLRYGRARTAGLAATAIHPALCGLLDDFLAVGTQLKTERPGKGTLVSPCDAVEPPIARLEDGTVREVDTYEAAAELADDVAEIVDLGEMLVPFGEFLENNKPLPPSSWCPEWWERLLEEQGTRPPAVPDDAARAAFRFAERTDTPLHPRFTLFWHDLDGDQLARLADAVSEGTWRKDELRLPHDDETKRILEALGATHRLDGDAIVLDERCSLPVARGTGHRVDAGRLEQQGTPDPDADALEEAQRLAGVPLKAKAPCRIGARMGRPEKAAKREMSPPVHGLFPIGGAGGLQRLIRDASQKGTIGTDEARDYNAIEAGARACPDCEDQETMFLDCPECGARTRPVGGRPKAGTIPLKELVDDALDRLAEKKIDPNTKGVQGLISETKLPEPLEKGILRAKRDIYVFKDGTCRYDMTDLALTQVRPAEIGTPVEEMREMGYTEAVDGSELEDPDQLVALKPQDVVVNEDALAYMARVARFVDDELTRLYGMEPYYDLDEPEDLVGHLAVGLAPHTSGGVLCRIIGTTSAAGHWCHPYFHAAKRRNCDGDEDCLMLLLDGLVNFSRWYLPDRRGGQMDAPLTLSIRVDPEEIDGEAHNVDCSEAYPLSFYEATESIPGPKDVVDQVEIVEDRLGTPEQYEPLPCTHDTTRLDDGPRLSAYKTIDTMMEKMEGQLSLGDKIRAVDAGDVASRVICDHFIPDIQGNLNAFTRQTVRCAKCNAKYRRVPLTGRCRKCRNELTMTVHEASVKKYVDIAQEVADNYDVDAYTQQRLKLIDDALESLFTNDKVEKAKLSDFL